MKAFYFTLILGIFLGVQSTAFSQVKDSTQVKPASEQPPKKAWYEIISLRGYTQVRYNRFLETNENLKCEQCDRSWGAGGGIFLRRSRLIFSGDVHKRGYIYIQPDFASSASATGLHFGQLRDAYFDLALDSKKEFRLRIGQSKIPYGFENLQSSQNRLPLDRADALNSAVANERDKAILFYWAPSKIRERFSYLVSSGLKGSGDYGVFGFGAFDGQTANTPEANDEPHIVTRLTYPFQLKNGQIFETSLQAYTGKYVVTTDRESDAKIVNTGTFTDRRVAASFVWYPQPFGIQTEYNIGEGPQFDPSDSTIKVKKLHGGYFQMEYMVKIKGQTIIPFVRTQFYDGGKKHETDARSYVVREHEIGVEWQPFKNFEMVTMYTISDRRFEDLRKPVNRQKGSLLRIQLQFNY